MMMKSVIFFVSEQFETHQIKKLICSFESRVEVHDVTLMLELLFVSGANDAPP